MRTTTSMPLDQTAREALADACKGTTQLALSKLIGISDASLSRALHGDRISDALANTIIRWLAGRTSARLIVICVELPAMEDEQVFQLQRDLHHGAELAMDRATRRRAKTTSEVFTDLSNRAAPIDEPDELEDYLASMPGILN